LNIDPTETPFISNIGKGKTSSYKTEWLTDTLASAALNQQSEAATASADAIGAGARLYNYITIFAKWFDISDVLEAADTAGNLGRISYQTAKKLKEIARDMEYTFINESTGSASDPYKSYGLKKWLGTATPVTGSDATNWYDFTPEATTNLLTEEIFTARQQAIWNEGGKCDMVLATAAQKKKVSSFNGANRITVNSDMTNKKVVNIVDFVENDFGVTRVYLERHILPSNTSYDYMFFLQKDLWSVLTMLPVKVEKLARTGLSQIVQISATATLKCNTEKGNAMISGLYNG
jgi:hypothetical protein